MSDHILEFWSKQAKIHKQSHAASWEDNYAIDLEIRTIGKHIREGDRVLDVGCANGYSAFHHLARGVQTITGVDFSPQMIEQAEGARRTCSDPARVSFKVGDVRRLPLPNAAFDLVYTTRTLINLPTWAEQQNGIAECLRVCRPGGKVILSEGFWEPLVLLNCLRSLVRLPSLVEHDFNRYIKKSNLEQHLRDLKMTFSVDEFSSVYYLGSRFLRELVTRPADHPGYSNPINKVFHEIELEYSGGGFGIQQAYILSKPS
jgi:ubiquinone/menaquinone biosynthesis C-methylase UbiE